MKLQPIVIIGGGTAGLRSAFNLERVYGHDLSVPIYLIDPSPHHVYTPSFYSLNVRGTYQPLAIPFKSIFEGKNIHFIQETAISVDPDARVVVTEQHQIPYEDLVLAVGQEIHLPDAGQSNHTGSSLKGYTYPDIVMALNDLALLVNNPPVPSPGKAYHNILIVGGGVPGVMLAATLAKLFNPSDQTRAENRFNTHITLLEAQDRLVPTLSPKASENVREFLRSKGVSIALNSPFSLQRAELLQQEQANKPNYRIIWTAPLKPHALAHRIDGLRHNENGRVLVNSGLQSIDRPNIWVGGDAAATEDGDAHFSSLSQGHYIARGIVAKRSGTTIPPYFPSLSSSILPLADDYGISLDGERVIQGGRVNQMQNRQQLQYLRSILPLARAITFWRHPKSLRALRLSHGVI